MRRLENSLRLTEVSHIGREQTAHLQPIVFLAQRHVPETSYESINLKLGMRRLENSLRLTEIIENGIPSFGIPVHWDNRGKRDNG
ncbi:hypothetical protein J6590_049890 [Homalodisca vitripennis]|nr:hypothetical protein J6590_049890 [Homalodisca vitripennis]